MKHDQFRELLLLSVSGSLDPDEDAVLRRHMESCAECRREHQRLQRLSELLGENRGFVAVDDRLLSEARQELRIALRKEALKSSVFSRWREVFDLRPGMRFALATSCALAVGLVVGRTVLTGSRESGDRIAVLTPTSDSRPQEGETKIANVRFLNTGNDGDVEFSFDAVTPVRMRGSVDDPRIQKVLTYAMLNEGNPGVRLRAVNAVTPTTGQPQDKEVKAALIQALRSDPNAGVRREALNTLRKFPMDAEIKQAFLHTLMADENPGLRVAAINCLDTAFTKSGEIGSEFLEVLKEKAERDNNNYIRLKAQAVLQEAKKQ